MTAREEEWRPVPCWPGYDVSGSGRVRSVPRILGDGRTAGGVLLRQTRDRKGYARVRLRSGGRTRTVRVHDLVAAAFLGPRPAGMQVLHRNDDHGRNGVADLRYGTPEANVAERVKRERRERNKPVRKRGRVRAVGSSPESGAGS